jgi:hypothetical protein
MPQKQTSDDSWKQLWDERQKLLEAVLGKADDGVLHAAIPLKLGGNADVLVFHPPQMGTTYVTADLIGEESQKRPKDVGNYELMICHREDREMWGPNLLSQLASYTLEAVLNRWDTMDIGPATPKGSTVAALFFVPYARFKFRGKPAALILCLGITKDELAFKMKNGPEALMTRLRAAGVYPFTDLKRKSVLG